MKKFYNEFLKIYGKSDKNISLYFCPGRVNLIGEHIDYNGGKVLPAALSIGIYGFIREREDNLIKVISMNIPNSIKIDIKSDLFFYKEDGWGNYIKGIIKYLKEDNFNIKGFDILLYSTLPDSSGLSSSAALEVLMGFMFLDMSDYKNIDKKYLSMLGKKVENKFLGINSGIMDQFSVAFGKKDNAILLNTDKLDYTYIPTNFGDYRLMILNTNKKRGLGESKYNERRKECEEALNIIQEHKKIEHLCQADIEDLEYLKDEKILFKRAKHVIKENKRVYKSIEALNNNNIKFFGEILNKSHESLKNDYEVTGKYLDCIVSIAQSHESCIGSRMTGAGFGGCAIALIDKKNINEFKNFVNRNYFDEMGLKCEIYEIKIEDGVKKLC
ncbi:MAG: galactokinase [Oceanotoga sp.]|uniref:galactokinase n=1 Tax=Oceanotoga sp. TaxID=2108366 RepID=UPI00264E7380|nr:galactokinase [Oceanotoga sp.]MDN5341135.1 galactokinase [Oceanotoga sp.]